VNEIDNLKVGYGLDSNGFIISDVSKDKIDGVYVPCIRESVENLKKLFHQQLHSVYVYGSVARGDAIAKKSDLDVIAMFNTKLQRIMTIRLTPQIITKMHFLRKSVFVCMERI